MKTIAHLFLGILLGGFAVAYHYEAQTNREIAELEAWGDGLEPEVRVRRLPSHPTN